jgi:plasmid stabilization system protein ParE
MIKEVVVSKEAVEDLEEGRIFYERRQPGIGDYFWDSLLSDMDSLSIFAGGHARQYGFFRMLSRRFPYGIYYEIDQDTAYIVAILPMRKDPAWIEARVRSRR